MSNVALERETQGNVKHWLINDLGYTYLGNREDLDNTPVLEDELHSHLKKCGYNNDQISRAISKLTSMAGDQTNSLYEANKAIYALLRYGFQGVRGEQGNLITVHYIDWANVGNNDFYVAEEVSVRCTDGVSRKRPDLILYINGIAIAMIELKRSCVSVGEGIRQMLTNQKTEYIQRFFNTMQLLIAGNKSEGIRYGTIETPEKFYLKWKEDSKAQDDLSIRIRELQKRENGNSLRDGLISLCHKERLLSILHDFIIYDAGIKKVTRHNQYFANIAARARILKNEGGIIWNTQGSGKSLIMVWLTKWIIENITDSRVVIITDREELDDQIQSLYLNVEENVKRATSCADLRDILNKSEDPIVCSLIHKYGHNAGKQDDIEAYVKELLKDLPEGYSAKGNIIAFVDECHRTNSGKLHKAVKTLMPNAILIGFTGTPLLEKDKETSIEIFGSCIHTYKFNEGVEDGVVLDLRYEARDVNQSLSSQDKVDQWFDAKTRNLTERAKHKLKQNWATLNKLYSAKERLERIAGDILFDMSIKPRLANDRGTAMLVASSVFEACRYWRIFREKGFTKCAVVTSYEPTDASVRTATSDPSQANEEEYKKETYEMMLGGKKQSEFEAEVKKQFKKTPAKMKLLIVVDKLLTGFDAPSATYLYIDKSMRDHELFQAVCRVNRPDGEDKDYGYIVDYKDLFRSLQSAIHDYTSAAFDTFDKKDVEGLLKQRTQEAKSQMYGSLSSLTDMLGNVPEPRADLDYIHYFCGEDIEDNENNELVAKRDSLYGLTASATRSFSNCCDNLESYYGYTEEQISNLREEIAGYNHICQMIKFASNDYIDLKPYSADMRYILDTYIRADESEVISKMENMSLVQLLLDSGSTTPEEFVQNLPGDDSAKPEMIEANIKHEIIKKMGTNPAYYSRLSEMLDDIIERRKAEAISYKEYLRQVVEMAQAILHPEEDDAYPSEIKGSSARMALYDYLNQQEQLTVNVDSTIRRTIRPDWKDPSRHMEGPIKGAIHKCLMDAGWESTEAATAVEEIYEISKRQNEYDQ